MVKTVEDWILGNGGKRCYRAIVGCNANRIFTSIAVVLGFLRKPNRGCSKYS